MNLKNSYLLLLTLAVISLAIAYFVQYIMHLPPCPLCVYQRYPYFIFILISIIALIKRSYKTYNKYIILTIIMAIILSGYHTGIERGIFELSSICKPQVFPINTDTTVAEFKNQLYTQEIALCNKPALVILGLSMTEWNLLLNLFLLGFLWHQFRNPKLLN